MSTLADLIYDKLMDNHYPDKFKVSKAENPTLYEGNPAVIEFTYDGKQIRVTIEHTTKQPKG